MSVAEINPEDSFIIRGHHLKHYFMLHNYSSYYKDYRFPGEENSLVYSSLEEAARRFTQKVIEIELERPNRDDILGLRDYYAIFPYVSPHPWDTYVLPSKKREQERKQHVIDAWGAIFTKFLVSPDSQPARIHGGLDDICKGCIIGDHCRTIDERLEDENETMAKFLSTYDDLYPEIGHLNTEDLRYPNGLNYHIRDSIIIESNLGVLRKVFQYMLHSNRDFNSAKLYIKH